MSVDPFELEREAQAAWLRKQAAFETWQRYDREYLDARAKADGVWRDLRSLARLDAQTEAAS